MDEQKLQTPEQEQETSLTTAPANQPTTLWNDAGLMKQAWKAAQFLSQSDLVPEQTYKNKPANCLVALDLANRTGLSPLIVMQNLYIVKGKPAWSGQFCTALINASGRFTPLQFITTENGTFCKATRLSDGEVCIGTEITWDMVKSEGWLDKSGSKWKTMPEQMFNYRAAAFWARKFCPELLMGIPTADEVKDVHGNEDEIQKETVVITLEDNNI